jgi:predicted DNA-binding transcriptional regulator AlpA
MTDEILLPPEVAERLRVSVETLAGWRNRRLGEGPVWLRLGNKKIGYLASEVDAYVARQQRIARDQQDRERRSA